MRLYEFVLQKNKWQLLLSTEDKTEASPALIGLVRRAYSSTPMGSFVNSLKDVVPSDWSVLSWDADPEIDACIFYRKPRPTESWVGYKIQGIGHDGNKISKQKVVEKLNQLLHTPGVWLEGSDAMRHVLLKSSIPTVTDVDLLRSLFQDPNLEMRSKDTYTRVLASGQRITETVFGHPKLK